MNPDFAAQTPSCIPGDQDPQADPATPPPRGSLTALLVSGAVLAPLVTLAGCDSPAPSVPRPSAPAVSLPSTVRSSSAAPENSGAASVRAAITAYRGMWTSYDTAVEVPDPSSPDLRRYATGEALQTLTKGLQSVKDQSLKGTGELFLSPHVSEVSPASAPTNVGVRDCFDDGATHLVRVGPGSPYHDIPGGRRLCTATIVLQPDGTWKVTRFALQKVGTC